MDSKSQNKDGRDSKERVLARRESKRFKEYPDLRNQGTDDTAAAQFEQFKNDVRQKLDVFGGELDELKRELSEGLDATLIMHHKNNSRPGSRHNTGAADEDGINLAGIGGDGGTGASTDMDELVGRLQYLEDAVSRIQGAEVASPGGLRGGGSTEHGSPGGLRRGGSNEQTPTGGDGEGGDVSPDAGSGEPPSPSAGPDDTNGRRNRNHSAKMRRNASPGRGDKPLPEHEIMVVGHTAPGAPHHSPPKVKEHQGYYTEYLDKVPEMMLRIAALEARPIQEEKREGREPGGSWADVQSELEHFRVFTEFVRSILPKEGQKAVDFWELPQGDGSYAYGGPMGAVLELQRRLAAAEDTARRNGSDIRGEHQKLEMVTKDLQGRVARYEDKVDDMQGKIGTAMQAAELAQATAQNMQNASRSRHRNTDDVAGAPSSLSGATIPLASAPEALLPDLNGESPRAGSGGADSRDGRDTPMSPGAGSEHGHGDSNSPRPPMPMMQGYSHIDPEPLPYITKRRFEEAVSGLREDMKAWLRLLQERVIAALQQKADQAELHNALEQLAISQGLEGDNVAMFAKRALIGRCASCDTPFQGDPGNIRMPQAVGIQAGMKPRDSLGAQVAIRAPERPPMPGRRGGSPASLPRIEKASNKDFPKGKVLRASASEADMRGTQRRMPPLSA